MQVPLEFFDILLKVPHLDSTFKQLLGAVNIFFPETICYYLGFGYAFNCRIIFTYPQIDNCSWLSNSKSQLQARNLKNRKIL